MKLWNRSYTLSLLCSAVLLTTAACTEPPAIHRDAPKVTYTAVQSQSVPLTSELSGRTSAFMVSEVRPQVSGIIQERLFVEGADVTAGQVLYQIDPSLYKAAYESARAALAKAEANAAAANILAQRYGTLVKMKAVSKQEYDNAIASSGQARAEVAAAKAALDTARINLEYTQVKAPVAGRIGRSSVTPGALVTQNQLVPLATVQQLDPMYVDLTQSSTDLLKLKRALSDGQLTSSGSNAAKIKLKLEDGTPYANPAPRADGSPDWIEGNLLFSDITVEQSTGVVTIRAEFPNPKGTLLPGMYVRAFVEEGVNEHAILVPQQFVARDTRGKLVAQVLTKNNPAKNATIQKALDSGMFTLESRTLTVDRSFGNFWLVLEGVNPGDFIQINALQMTRPGMLVHGIEAATGVVPGAPAGAPAAPATNEKK